MPRPRAQIDEKVVINLAKIGCTYEEIAAVVGVSKDTIERRFKDKVHEGWQHRNASIRRKQYTLAMSDVPVQNQVAMLIWLGKQYLGQRDGEAALQKDSGGRLDELLQAFNAGPKERGTTNT